MKVVNPVENNSCFGNSLVEAKNTDLPLSLHATLSWEMAAVMGIDLQVGSVSSSVG